MGFPNLLGHTLFLAPAISIALILRLILIHSFSLKRKLGLCLFFALGFCTFGYYWIPQTLSVFGEINAPWNFLMGSALSLILIPQLFGTTLLIHYKKNLPLIVYPFVFALLEYFLPQQFPGHVGHGWLNMAPYLGLAPYVGVPVFTFISLWFLLSLFTEKKFRLFPTASFLIFLTLNLIIPLNPVKNPEKIFVRMMQPNIGNFLKLGAEQGHFASRREMFKFYYDLTLAPTLDGKKLDLIIWPETAYPELLSSSVIKNDPELVPFIVKDLVTKTQTELFFGGYDSQSENVNDSNFQTEYNAGFLISLENNLPLLSQTYRKIRLIPFGEGLPFGPLNKWLSGYIKNISFFAQGEEFSSFKLNNEKRFVSAICYEVLFSDFIKDMLQAQKEPPHFLLNITNDSWYGKTMEPYQHFFLAKWRALEFNLPLVRSTNTGLSRIALPDGRELGNGGLFTAENIDLEFVVEKDPVATIYQRFGIFILIGLFSILYFAQRFFSLA